MACDITIARASTEFQLEHRASVHKPINGRLPSHPSRFGLPDVCNCAADASSLAAPSTWCAVPQKSHWTNESWKRFLAWSQCQDKRKHWASGHFGRRRISLLARGATDSRRQQNGLQMRWFDSIVLGEMTAKVVDVAAARDYLGGKKELPSRTI